MTKGYDKEEFMMEGISLPYVPTFTFLTPEESWLVTPAKTLIV